MRSWRDPLESVVSGKRARRRRGGSSPRRRTAPRCRVEPLEGRVLRADDFGADLLTAAPVALDATGSGRVTGVIEVNADADLFRFVPPVDGLLAVRMDAVPGGTLDSFLRIEDGGGVRITSNDDVARGNLNSRVRFLARAGQFYHARARGNGATSGGYAVTFEGARDIMPTAAGSVRLAGAIEEPNDLDLYRFVAPIDGVLEARLEADLGGGLDGTLTVFDVDDPGTIRSRADDADGVRDGLVRFVAEAGRTYYAEVSSVRGASTGGYALSLGPVAQQASIEVPGEVDTVRFVAPATGFVTIRQDAVFGSALDSVLSVSEAGDGGASRLIAGSDDSRGTRNSLVRIRVEAGRTYVIRAAGFGSSTGPYTLTIAPDDFGDDFDSARPIELPPAGSLVLAGTIDADGDLDVFQFTAPAAGRVTLRQKADGSDLDSFTTVFDEARRPIAFGDDSTGSKDSVLEFDVQEGQRYFVRAGAFPNVSGLGRFGAYRLSLDVGPRALPDDHGATVVDATPLAPDPVTGFVRTSGAIGTPADVDGFRVVAPRAGSLQARLDPTRGSTLRARLTVFDDSGRPIATDDDASVLRGRAGSTLQWDVEAGRAYFVQAAGYGGTTGGYDLSLFVGAPTTPAPDDFGGDFGAAAPIGLDTNGSGSLAGAIGTPGDVDAFRFVAPATGQWRIRLDAAPGSRLDPVLFALDDSGSPLAQNDDIDGSSDPARTPDRNSLILLGTMAYPVVAGKTYVLKAAGFGATTGLYQLTVALISDFDHPGRVFDDVPDTLPSSPADPRYPEIEAGAVPTRLMAAIDSVGDVDVVRVVARASGTLTVRQVAEPGSGLDPVLEAYDRLGFLIAGNNDDKGTRDSLVRFNVTAGETYFLRAGAFGGFTATGPNVGRYTLLLEVAGPAPGADVGDTFETAAPLDLPPTGILDLAGLIDIPGDVDVFGFTAPLTGTVTIRQGAAPGDGLDSFLAVFDTARDLIATGDDTAGSLDAVVTFSVQQGREYFVRAAGYGASVGRYQLSVRPAAAAPPDTTADPFAGARRVDIDPKLLTAVAFGSIDFAGDADVFRLVAPVTGPLRIRQEWTAGSELDSFLFAYDDQRRLIASNDDDGRLPDAAVVVNAARGQVIYVRATSSERNPGPSRRQTGAFRLVVAPLADDVGNTFPEARAIEAEGTTTGTIEAPGDVDLFEFVAPETGRLAIRLRAAPGSGLDPVLVAFDDGRNEIARDDDAVPGARSDSLIWLRVARGRHYVLRASGYGISVGSYRLEFDPVAADGSGPDGDPASGAATGAGAVGGLGVAGKGTFEELGSSFTRRVPRIEPEPGRAQQVADAISDDLARRFLASLGGPPGTSYLLLWLDPVDFRTTDPQHRLTGYTADQGAIHVPAGAYYSGKGVLQLLLIPEATYGRYSLELIGDGPDPVLFGARLITADGRVLAPVVSFPDQPAGGLPVNPPVKASLVAILDFSPGLGVSEPEGGTGPSGTVPPPDAPVPPGPAIGVPGGAGRSSGAGRASTPGLGLGRAGVPGLSAPARTVTAGLVDALIAQIRAGGGLPAGSAGIAAGPSAVAGEVVLAAVSARVVSTGPGASDAQDGRGRPGGEPVRARVPNPGRALATRLHALRDRTESLRRAFGDAWEALQAAAATFFGGGAWTRPNGDAPTASGDPDLPDGSDGSDGS
ncbi:MAG TPA: hypothetical protein VF590_23920, partial [Isosphaeraceae bacterium]